MPKLKLNVESLLVDTFEVEGLRPTSRGTVHGAMNVQTITTCEYSGMCQTGEDCGNTWSEPTNPVSACTGCVDYTNPGPCPTYANAGC